MNTKTAILFATLICLALAGPLLADDDIPAFVPDSVVLFQGDSITDGGRGRSMDPNHIYGQDYAYIIAAKFSATFPDRHVTFYNRGVSGNRVSDLLKRWPADTIALKPTILSILIGVNDVGPALDKNEDPTAEQFQKDYDDLLSQTVAALPGIKLVLIEPFGLPVGKIQATWDQRLAALKMRQVIVEALAEKYHAALVKPQEIFDAACSRAPAEFWIWDGVHPTMAGHQLLADEWCRVVRETWPAR
jgi:lysophospholipase L1-like esterase